MKSRSAIFVFVLLLLTVTVCAAQAQMGFSPYEFYQNFVEINAVLEGPECSYEEGSDGEDGDYIVVSDDIFLNLLYSGSETTEIYYVFTVASDDDETLNNAFTLIYSTFITAAYESGADLGNLDFEELDNLIGDLIDGNTVDYCGYHFEFRAENADDSVTGVLWVTNGGGSSTSSSSSSGQASYSEGEEAFFNTLDGLVADNLIPTGGTYYAQEDYTDEWAQIDWYQWNTFDSLKNFVFSATVSWASAHERPNADWAGCGVVFREIDKNNMLTATLNMDGYARLIGYRYGNWLYYPNYNFGSAQTKGKHQFVVVANEDVVTVYVDGTQTAKWRNVAINEEGYIGLATMSGTNKGFGTRCEWKDIYYYTW